MAKLNATRYALLGMLSLQSACGYDIKKRMRCSTDHFWSESDGAIYPILKKLLEEQKVTCEVENPESGKPKKIYTLTEAGQTELNDWLARRAQATPGRSELLLKLFFGANVDKHIMLQHIEQHQQKEEQTLATYRTIEEKLSAHQGSPQAVYQLITSLVMIALGVWTLNIGNEDAIMLMVFGTAYCLLEQMSISCGLPILVKIEKYVFVTYVLTNKFSVHCEPSK